MISEFSSIKDNYIKSDINILSEQFIRGETFSNDLLKYIFDNIVRVKEREYTESVREVKKLLSSSKIVFYHDLVLIKSNTEISEEEKVVIVRYINLCHHDKKLILLYNDEIIYIPMEFIVEYGKEAIYLHIHSTHKKYIHERKIKYISKKISWKKVIPFLH